MTPYDLYVGDCIDVMRSLPAGSVDAIVTSPPYAMQRGSTYGGVPEADYPEWTVAWMEEARRVLTDDGSAIINISPHVKNGELSDYVLRTRLALREDGWTELAELIWHKTTAMPVGNINRPRRHWESLLWYGKHGRPYSDAKANGNDANNQDGGGQHIRNGWKHYGISPDKSGYPARARSADVVSMAPNQESVGHPAPFPWRLAEWCGRLITPPGGTILDPFAGSSSTGVAAIRNGWHFIGVDLSPEYIETSAHRLEYELDRIRASGSDAPTR